MSSICFSKKRMTNERIIILRNRDQVIPDQQVCLQAGMMWSKYHGKIILKLL